MNDLYDILCSDDVVDSIRNNLDTLITIIPELKYTIGFDHKHPHHHLDVFEHTLLALSMSPNDFTIRLVLLLHDIGKPFSYQECENMRHFKEHPIVSANMSKVILKRIGYDELFIEKVCYLVREHDTPISNKAILDDYDLQYTRYIIQECDGLAHNPDKLEKRINYLNKVRLKLRKD